MSLRVLACLAFACLSRAALAAQAPPETPPADATSFAREYDAAQTLTAKRKWKPAREAWIELLRRHAGAAYVRPRLAEIRELVKKCAFWSATREPDPKSCVAGELLYYDPYSGRIRVKYTPAELGDFERPAGSKKLVHPMHFSAAYELEIEGDPDELAENGFYVAMAGDSAIAVKIGARRKGSILFFQHQLIGIEGPRVTPIERTDPAERSSTKPAKASIRVDERRVELEYDRTKVLSAANPRERLGSFALDDPPRFDTLIVSGKVDAGWIDGLIDARVQEERRRFDQAWHDPPELGAWADGRPVESREQALRRLFEEFPLPGRFTPPQKERIDRITRMRAEGQAAAAIAELASASDDEIPRPARELLLALCENVAGRPQRALAHLDELARLAPPGLAVAFLRARLLGRVERDDEAIEALRALAQVGVEAEVEVERWFVHAELAERLLFAARHEEARAALERGLELAGSTPELEKLRVQLAKAAVGPSWRRSFSHASELFAVETDVDYATARLVTKELDEAWAECARLFGALEAPGPTRAYVFSGRASYEDYIRGIADEGIENTAGVYSKTLDQIVVWNQPSRDETSRALRHECVHRYVDLALGLVPRWYEEGLAESFAAAKRADGTWVFGTRNEARLEHLRRDPRISPLQVFLRETDEQFMRAPEQSYAQAWALVHFLRGAHDGGNRFEQRLWDALRERTDALAAIESALEDIDVGALQTDFVAHVNGMMRER